MNKKDKRENDDNRIDEIAKQIFGYDEESLLKDFKSAEQEANTNIEESQSERQYDADPTLAALMARVQERGLQPIYQKDYDKQQEEKRSRRRVVRLKAMWRPMAVAAVMIVISMATAIISQGKRGYWFWERDVGGNKSILNNIDEVISRDPLYDVYKDIEESLDIRVMMLSRRPVGFEYIRYSIEKNTAFLEFQYKGNTIYLLQVKSETPLSFSTEMDMKKQKVVKNYINDQDIVLSRNDLENGETELYGDLSTKDVQYRLFGKMDEDTFIEILEYLEFMK